ncbi:MAG: ion channel activity [Chaenotheca gracillima]|nr:MAG: ion channel activity [Chaenotheca gracillima]
MIEALESSQASRSRPHPYLTGNFAPLHRVQPLTRCSYSGIIPEELAGGEYVRNGGNPVTNEDLGRDAHFFDGDGMLSGVAFRRVDGETSRVQPEFVNQFILTDVYLSSLTTPTLLRPILPSIATLVDPLSSLLKIACVVFRAILLVILSRLPGSQQAIKKISVANTSILYHDGRALATCESGPPMRVSLPGLETVGWFNGHSAEGESGHREHREGFGGKTGLISFMREWTTAHPRVDPRTDELILFHSTFIPPYIHYSIVPSAQGKLASPTTRLLNAPVPGVSSAKMMHDFGVGATHTVIMDLPLSLDPTNLARNLPVVAYNPSGVSRFGVFPRRHPEAVRWFETAACCIFHTANTWHEETAVKRGEDTQATAVNMLACRLTSASLVFTAGHVAPPPPIDPVTGLVLDQEDDQCRLYYYRFDMMSPENAISHQFALSAIPFEFPSIRDDAQMTAARYIYGCSVSNSSFSAALGRAAKIDTLAKIDVLALIERGKRDHPSPITGCVDNRNIDEILVSDDPADPIKLFKMPDGWYAQEPQFVPRNGGTSEDDGWLLTYVFDESQLDPTTGEAGPAANSELWIIDARNMRDVVAKVRLPQRVPYGLHGDWFSEDKVQGQRPIETVRSILPSSRRPSKKATALGEDAFARSDGFFARSWRLVRWSILEKLG